MILNKNDFKVFNIFLFFWLTLGWLAFVLTLAGIFHWWILAGFIAFTIAFGIRFFIEPLFKISKTFLFLNLSLFIIITAFSIYTSPTVFSGRDQGSISEAAIRLSQNNQLEFNDSVSRDFFELNSIPRQKMAECLAKKGLKKDSQNSLPEKINIFYCHAYSSGKALNFPGFFYTPEGNLVTQFPLVYISWLSFFYSFLGLFGFTVANAILLYIFLISIFLTSCKLNDPYQKNGSQALINSIIALALILTSFSFSWFAKFTLTENMAMALLWAGILQLTVLTESKMENLSGKKTNLIILFSSLGLLIFSRIEGLAFFVMALAVLFLNKNIKKYFRRNFIKLVLPAVLVIGLFSVWNLVADIYFYKAIAKSFTKDLSENAAFLDSAYPLPALSLLKIFALYGILVPLFLGIFCAIYLLKKRNYQRLIPFIVALPSFIYVFSPQITPDHPWMLRRFVFAVLPVVLVYSVLLFTEISNSKIKSWVIILYKYILMITLILNIPSLIYFFNYTPGNNLLEETKKISQNFTNNDLILIDQRASGDSQNMIGAPMNFLFDKKSVYFFNPDDLKNIDTKKYNKVYLIVPKNMISYYKETSLKDKLVPFKEYSIKTDLLLTESNKISFPKKETVMVEGMIFEIKK